MWKLLLITFTVLGSSLAEPFNETLQHSRDSKLFSMFQVIKFPNDPCVATNSRNGTCYTTSECTTKGGTSAGSCASGFGVCCTFILGCGGSAAQNCTYVENSGASSGVCKYTICKSNSNVCQLRLDFVSFVITGPSTRTASIAIAMTSTSGVGVSDATQCATDIFTVSSASNTVPVLCGTLTNDHLYVDAQTSCNSLTFVMSASAVTGATIPTRSWQIKVTQYNCDYSNRAPPGCLQYFFNTAGTGTVRSFNYGATTPYHLANQKQSICVRREAGYCKICWYTATAITDFLVSGNVAPASADNAGVIKQSECCGYGVGGAGVSGYDCVMIPGASKTTGAYSPPSFCGRRLITAIAITQKTVCSKQTPFQISFFSDNWENASAAISESAQAKSGFQLVYAQSSTNC